MTTELLILIVIVLLIVFPILLAFFSAKTEAKNEAVLTDVRQILKALKIYRTENGFYPYGNGVPIGISDYLDHWPLPSNVCRSVISYQYSQKLSGDDFELTFCLSSKTGGFASGLQTLTAKNIN